MDILKWVRETHSLSQSQMFFMYTRAIALLSLYYLSSCISVLISNLGKEACSLSIVSLLPE